MYTFDGIKNRSPLTGTVTLIPWDSRRAVCLRSGDQVTRHTLVLREEHFPIYVGGNGVGGFRRERDAGLRLVVDRLNDGRWIDYLEKPKTSPPRSTRTKLTDAQRSMLRAIDNFGEPDENGWAEIELQFLSHRDVPRYLEAATCVNVARALESKGLISGPNLTQQGEQLMHDEGRTDWRDDGRVCPAPRDA